MARNSNEPLAISETTLKKRLNEQHMLASIESARGTLTVRRRLAGHQYSVLHLRAELFTGADVGISDSDVGSMSDSGTPPDTGSSSNVNDLQANVGKVRSNGTTYTPTAREGVTDGIVEIQI